MMKNASFNDVVRMSAEYLIRAIESNSDDIIDVIDEYYTSNDEELNSVSDEVQGILIRALEDAARNPSKYRQE